MNRHRQKGIALVTSLAILVAVGALVLGVIFTTRVELAVTRNDSTSTQAQYVAQAGLQKYKSVLFQNFRWSEEGEASGGSNLDACMTSISNGFHFDRDATTPVTEWDADGQISFPAESVTNAAGSSVIGEYEVTLLADPGNASRVTIRSVGRTTAGDAARQATATASGTYLVRNSSTLEQAIFAGMGSDMRFVNGNTTVYGGVYIVGDRDDPNTVVIESNGNFGVYNGYDKTGDTTNSNFLVDEARFSENLCAALRVERGTVKVGGSTQLGQPDNRLLTVAVSRGAEDVHFDKGGTEDCLKNKGTCTEIGPRAFDIEEPPDFPDLDEPPGTEFCPTGTWRNCIRDEAQVDGMTLTTDGGSTIAFDPPLDGLTTECQAVLSGAATTKLLAFDDTAIDCTHVDTGVTYGFSYDPAFTPAKFLVHGNLNLRGFDLDFTRDTVYQARSRDDDGLEQNFAGLSVEAIDGVGGNVVARGDFASDQALGKFPENVVTIIAENDVDFGKNHGYYTVPVYAGNQFRIRGNAQLFGQVIGNQFCTTNDVGSCSTAGNPAEIVFVPTGETRAESFRAVSPSGGLPTFETVGYELR